MPFGVKLIRAAIQAAMETKATTLTLLKGIRTAAKSGVRRPATATDTPVMLYAKDKARLATTMRWAHASLASGSRR